MSHARWNWTGSGKAFSAGMDLGDARGDRTAISSEKSGNSRRMGEDVPAHLSFSKPLIRRREWGALAGGCGIADTLRFTLAVPEAKFGYTEVKIGFSAGDRFCFSSRQIGEKRNSRPFAHRKNPRAGGAKEIGLINEIVPAEKLMERAKELADILIAASPGSVTRAKRLLTSAAAAE